MKSIIELTAISNGNESVIDCRSGLEVLLFIDLFRKKHQTEETMSWTMIGEGHLS